MDSENKPVIIILSISGILIMLLSGAYVFFNEEITTYFSQKAEVTPTPMPSAVIQEKPSPTPEVSPTQKPTPRTEPTEPPLPTAVPTLQTALEEELPVIKLVSTEYPPLTGEDLPNGGMLTDIVNRTFLEMGYSVTIAYREVENALKATQKGDFTAAFPYARSLDTKNSFHASHALYSLDVAWFAAQDFPRTSATFQELEDFRCCQPLDYSLYTIQPMLEKYALWCTKRTETLQDCFEMVQAGEVDLIPVNPGMGWQTISQAFGTREGFRTLDAPVTSYSLHLMVAKTVPEGLPLLFKFNKTLRELETQGVIEEIQTRHLSQTAP